MERYIEQVLYKNAVLKNFAIFKEEHLCWSLFLNKSAGLRSFSPIKKRLLHRFFPVNIVKYLRRFVLKNICERLFERFPTWANNVTSNIGIEEDILWKTKQNKNSKKTCLFKDALDHFVFFYISTACLRQRVPYITKDDGRKDFKTAYLMRD